ncbi:MAG: glycosyltransferase family 4 protein [Brevundimonas sp.]|uniref:glycosyltransferase family 4 protein n=1 Tax=Brevundimonas sp. TaxID=1871086 RepID=UPI0022BBC6F9|nr:glycosyltransferase [Brevundimonas sp.]
MNSTTVLFDATRLLSRANRDAPTGIDRVCLAYAEWLLSLRGVVVEPVRTRRGELLAVDLQWFEASVRELRDRWNGDGAEGPAPLDERLLLDALETPRARRQVVRSPLEVVEPAPARRLRVIGQFLRSTALKPRRAARRTYINVAHTGLEDDRVLARLRAEGVRVVVLIHDLIPITHPEYCRSGDDERHSARVRTALRHADQVLVNSGYTRDELIAYARREGLRTPPVDVAYLGLEPIFMQPPEPLPAAPYFVHVGTIEARKNLALLLTVWRRLEERMGAEAPQLVLIGRFGWENEAVLDHLERSPAVGRLTHHLSDVSDATVARIMAGAQAVLAPSSIEGFDLPALEACALGAPLIASDIPVHRELVPDAMLIDPLDGLGWLNAVERATREPPKPPRRRVHTWAQHFAEVGTLLGLEGRAPTRHEAVASSPNGV